MGPQAASSRALSHHTATSRHDLLRVAALQGTVQLAMAVMEAMLTMAIMAQLLEAEMMAMPIQASDGH